MGVDFDLFFSAESSFLKRQGQIGQQVFDSCAQTIGPAYASMILTDTDGLQQVFSDQEFTVTAFGEFAGARSFGHTSQLLPYGVPLTAGTLGVLLTYYFGGWLP